MRHQRACDLKRDPCLADTARSDERDNTVRRHQVGNARCHGLPADQLRSNDRQIARRRPGYRLRYSRPIGFGIVRRGGPVAKQPVALPRRCRNQAAIGAQCLADCRDVNLQHIFLNRGTRPDTAQQFVLADQRTG